MERSALKATNALQQRDGLIAPERIIEFRRRYGLSQEKLEQFLGIAQKTVVRWERGTVPPSRAPSSFLLMLDAAPRSLVESLLIQRGILESIATWSRPIGNLSIAVANQTGQIAVAANTQMALAA